MADWDDQSLLVRALDFSNDPYGRLNIPPAYEHLDPYEDFDFEFGLDPRPGSAVGFLNTDPTLVMVETPGYIRSAVYEPIAQRHQLRFLLPYFRLITLLIFLFLCLLPSIKPPRVFLVYLVTLMLFMNVILNCSLTFNNNFLCILSYDLSR